MSINIQNDMIIPLESENTKEMRESLIRASFRSEDQVDKSNMESRIPALYPDFTRTKSFGGGQLKRSNSGMFLKKTTTGPYRCNSNPVYNPVTGKKIEPLNEAKMMTSESVKSFKSNRD